MPNNIVAYLYLLIGLLLFSGCGQDIEEKLSPEEISPSIMKVHYIDVGQADATLLEFGDENGTYTMLIDTGNWNSSDVVSYLQHQKITSIDIIAITHPHADHIGQVDQIIETFDVTEVWMNGETTTSEVFSKALAAIEKNSIDYYEPKRGDVFDIGPLEVTVLHPSLIAGSTNNNSIALRMQYGSIAFLFTGDAEEQAENEMLSQGLNLQAQVLQMGHHGSNTSSNDTFLQAVNPEVAIYSAGAENQYGHPHIETINRILANNTDIYGTDIHGTIVIETDGKTFNVSTHKNGTLPRTSVAPTEHSDETKSTPISKDEPKETTESCVNINEASESDIQQIIHIGTSRARDLIQLRPFESVDDLNKIKGIGPTRIDDIIAQGIACLGG